MHNYQCDQNSDLLSVKRIDNNNIKILSYLLLDGCCSGNLDIVKECLSKGCDINFQDYDKRTALHIACEEEKEDIIELINLKTK